MFLRRYVDILIRVLCGISDVFIVVVKVIIDVGRIRAESAHHLETG